MQSYAILENAMSADIETGKEIPLLAKNVIDALPRTDDVKIHVREMHSFATALSRQGHMAIAGKLRDIVNKGEGKQFNIVLAAGRLKMLSIVLSTMAANFGQSAQVAVGAAVDGIEFSAAFALPDAELGEYIKDQLIRTYAMLGLCEPNQFQQHKIDGPDVQGKIITE